MESPNVSDRFIQSQKVKQTTFKSYWLTIGEMRLDASFYAEDATTVDRTLRDTGYPLLDLRELIEDVFYPPRIKRNYTTASTNGIPYLTASETQSFIRFPDYIFPKSIKHLSDWYVKEGWILVTRSGTVGLVTLTTKELEKYVLSEHMIRIIPKKETLVGYLYAYLCSHFGQTFIEKEIYGGVVQQVEPHHIQSIPVPMLPDGIQRAIHENMLKIADMRDKARKIIHDAERCFYEELALPELRLNIDRQAFSICSSDFNLRFDASFHDPTITVVKKALEKAGLPLKRIGNPELSKKVFLPERFKRNYVSKEFGVPFFSGRNTMQTKPHHLKYISKKTADLDDYVLSEGMVLVTARGTIGRIYPVTRSSSGWAASDNIARIVPNETNYGYLACFLSTSYGQTQILGQTAGSNIPLIQPHHIEEVYVPIPHANIQEKIGNMVIQAYELKELANRMEDETIKTLEVMLKEHKNCLEPSVEYLREIDAYLSSFELIGNSDFHESRLELDNEETISLEDFKKANGF